jgi:hypothetical protein
VSLENCNMACLNVPSDAGLVLAVTLSVLVSHWGGVASPKARHACPQYWTRNFYCLC